MRSHSNKSTGEPRFHVHCIPGLSMRVAEIMRWARECETRGFKFWTTVSAVC